MNLRKSFYANHRSRIGKDKMGGQYRQEEEEEEKDVINEMFLGSRTSNLMLGRVLFVSLIIN